MNLDLYRPTQQEKWISSIYQQHGIRKAEDLDINHVASIFGGLVKSTAAKSHVRWDDDNKFFVIFLNQSKSEQERRFDFFHELAHPLLHVDKQTGAMPDTFSSLQETQAKQFQLYASMPAYIIQEESCSIMCLREKFNLPEVLIRTRVDQIKRRILQAQYDHKIVEFNNKLYLKSNPENWSTETKNLLKKLHSQVERKKVESL